MEKILHTAALLLLIITTGFAQGSASWQTHLSYFNTTAVEETNNHVFGVANGSLYSFNNEDQSLKSYSTRDGLSDTQISRIGFNSYANTLVIIYANGNIDLMVFNENRIVNLPYLKEDVTISDKSINSIYFHEHTAYLSTSFGVIVLNLSKREVADTYRLNTNINSVTVFGENIYAAADKSILTASLSSNLLDYNNWTTYPISLRLGQDEYYKSIHYFQNRLTFLVKGNDNHGLYYRQDNGSVFRLTPDRNLNDVSYQNDKLMVYSDYHVIIFYTFDYYIRISNRPVYGISSRKDKDTYWIATGDTGIKGVKWNGSSFDLLLGETKIDSPIRNYCAYMSFQNGKLIVAGGSRWTDRNYTPGTLMVYDGNNWMNIYRENITEQTGLIFADITSAAINPNDNSHYYTSSWGEGLYEFKGDQLINLYSYNNSPLESTITNNPNYVRVEGVTFDSKGNLWMTNSGVNSGIKVLTTDGNWEKLDYLGGEYLIDKILITNSNKKWINVLRGNSYIFVLDDAGTIGDTSDDRTRSISNFYQYMNGQLNSINVSYYYCLTEDKNGTIWIGTNIGPLICYSPDKVLNNPTDAVTVNRLTRIDNDGLAGYFLDGENIRVIAVDADNNKWIGTETTGVIVVNEDGTETLEHFTTDNSPLPSNNIQSIAINENTGEVFIGTDKGIVSYMSGVTTGGEYYSDVYAYPNPVRPEYNDRVTITGLISNSNVKITDLNGNIIYQGKSSAGEFVWDCRNRNGERVATGVYLVLVSEPNKGESVATKIMVIK